MVLISVGVPVRNGAQTLARAVGSIRAQTHTELEIIISDNASSDSTARLCQQLAAADARIRVLQHATAMTAVRNFRATFEAAQGDFFMWAAHDDWRSPNFIEVLLPALQSDPRAVVAFSDVVLFDDLESSSRLTPLDFDFVTRGLPLLARLEKTAQTAPYHVYGLIRSAALRAYPWYESDYAPDWSLMQWLAASGDFVKVSGAQTFFYAPSVAKTEKEKAKANALRRLGPFPRARIALTCASAVVGCGARETLGLSRPRLAWQFYLWQNGGLKHLLFSACPSWLQKRWRHLRPAQR